MIKNITVAADNTDKLIACTESVWSSQAHGVFGDEFYISDNGGASWVRINDDQHQFGGLGNGNFIVGDTKFTADVISARSVLAWYIAIK